MPSSSAFLVLASLLLLSTPPAAGQEAAPGGTDAERLEAAKAEQAKEKEAAARSAQEQARAEADAEEAQRLEKIGVDPAEAPPEESKGFFIGLEAAYQSLSDADRVVARESTVTPAGATAESVDTDADGLPDAFTATAGEDVALEYGSELAPRLEVGFRRRSGGAISLRYWAWSASASAEAAGTQRIPEASPSLGDVILGNIDNQGYPADAASLAAHPGAFSRPFGSPRQIMNLQLHGADSVQATGDFEAMRMDLLYSRTPVVRQRLEVGFRLGLTYLTLERQESATFQWRSFSRSGVFAESSSVEEVAASAKSDGLGITVGLDGRFGLTANRRWSIRTGMEVAGVSADQELAFRDAQLFSQPSLPPQPMEVYQDTTNEDAGQITTIIGVDLAFEYRFKNRARLGFGYRGEWWMDALTEERYPDPVNTAGLEADSVDISFGGPYLRVAFFF